MTWSFVPARRDFPQYSRHWDALNERLYQSHPMLASRFVEPLVKYFAADDTVLAVHRRQSEIDGLLLLRPGRYKWMTFLPSQTQIAPVLLPNGDSVASLLSALPATTVALDLLCQDPEYSVTPALAQDRRHERTTHATTLNISLSGTFEAYWQARPRKLRQNIRRHLRSLEDASIRYELRVHDNLSSVRDGLHSYAEIESRGWKAQGGTAIRLDTTQGLFYADLLTRFADLRAAAIYELQLGDQIAASQITLSSQHMLITLKTTYDERFASFSPGYVLDYLLLQREFAAKRFSTVEYYTNATAELLRWGTGQRVISHHRLYRHAWTRPLVHALRRFGHFSRRQPTTGSQPLSQAPKEMD